MKLHLTNKARNKLSMAIVTALSLTSTFSFAQQNEQSEKDIEVVEVTGIQSQLTKAAATKRYNVQFVDAISADDMGKLPDTNVAESLQRVSGVQLERGIGEGSSVSIRGLNQNVILINGRQVITAGGRGDIGPDTLESSTYSLLSLIPSSLVSSLEVSKLPSASQIEGALGGVVDIKTRKPLSQDGQSFIASVTGTYNDLSEGYGHEASAYYANQFLNDTLGVQFAVSHSTSPVQEEGLNTFSGYGYDNEVTGDPEDETLVFRDFRYWEINDDRDKTGANAMIQWLPDEDTEVYFDTFYSKVDSDRDRYWTGFWNCCGYQSPEITENGVLASATVNRPVQSNTEYAQASSEFLSSALGARWYIDKWEISAELAYTDSDSHSQQDYVRFQSQQSVDVAFDLLAGNDVPQVTFDTGILNDADALDLAIMFDNTVRQDTSDIALRTDLVRTLSGDVFTSIDFGARINQVETTSTEVYRDVRPNFALSSLPQIYSQYSNTDFFSGDGPAVNARYLVLDKAIWNGCSTLSEYFDEAQQAECDKAVDLPSSYEIDEDFLAVYGKANFDTELMGYIVSGNIGARYVTRDLTSKGHVEDFDGNISPYTSEVSNNELLPSAVVKVDLSDDWVLRGGLARTLTFPNTVDLSNGLLVRGDFTGVAGNPELEPFLINQADMSLEWYFDESSVLSTGLFYKDVESFIVNTIQPRTVPGVGQEVFISQPVNGEGGKIQGVELLYQQPLTFLPGWMRNFGIMSTYSYIDSETPFQDGRGNQLPIPGLSENNVNFILYYETDTYGLRLAYNWRDDYLGYLGSGDNGVYYKSYEDLALTANWQVTENFTVNLEAINLLDTRQKQFAAFEEAIQRNVEFGTRFKLTVSASF